LTDGLTAVKVRRRRVEKDCDTPGLAERLSVWGIRSRIALGHWVRSLLRPGSYVIGGFAVAYAVCQLLKAEEVPSKEQWDGHHALGRVLVGTGVVAIVGTFLVFPAYARVLRKADQNDELEEACRAVWHLVVEKLGIDMKKVGVHVWAVKGIKGVRYLEKRATFIIESRRQTHVTWRKGKGAIGIAWADDEPIVANVEHLQERGPTQELFCAITRRERFGLGWHDFRRSNHYRAILAIPLRARGKVRGCLSVDLRVDGRADDLDTVAQDDQFNNVLVVCEAVLAKRR
jgi:hypothetical protein